MKVNITTKGEKEITQALSRMGKEKQTEFKQEVYASALDIQSEARGNLKESHTWDLGNLANSILVDRIDNNYGAEIGPTAPYGLYVEYGTKPHFPPPDALEGWAKRHGFDSVWPICLAIAKRGLPARPFLIPAWEKVVKKFYDRVKGILTK